MTDIKSFLLDNVEEVVNPTQEITFAQFGSAIVVRGLSSEEFANVRKSATRAVRNKSGVLEETLDENKFEDRLIEAAVVVPNLMDADLQAFYHTEARPSDMLRKTLRAGQFTQLIGEINKLNGFKNDAVDDLVDEVKK